MNSYKLAYCNDNFCIFVFLYCCINRYTEIIQIQELSRLYSHFSDTTFGHLRLERRTNFCTNKLSHKIYAEAYIGIVKFTTMRSSTEQSRQYKFHVAPKLPGF